MPPVRMSRRLASATRTVVEVVVERCAARPPARSTADRLAAAAETARSWRARVTECADRAYDAERGRIDWEAVATELGLPLIGCLHMFDASLSAVAVRRLPDQADWSEDDEHAMAEFVSDNFGTLAGDVWRLAGVYINASEADCIAAYRRLKRAGMTVGVYEAIQKFREDGVPWKEIQRMLPVYKDYKTLQCGFGYAKMYHPGVASTKKAPTKWTPAETERIREIVRQRYTPSHPLPAINAAVCEFPSKLHGSVAIMIRRIACREGLVDAATGSTHGSATAASTKPASRQAGRKTGCWTLGEYARLDALVAEYQGAPINWAAVAAALGRTHRSCRAKHAFASIRQKAAEPRQEHAGAVNQEVQRQYESGLDIDWAAVSQVVDLSEIKCLELCRFSEGKARWTYDPDTFSQEMADRMEAFIAEHYPPPTAPNFNAVSNHMWIDINDCIRMARMLRGEFEWADEAKARAVRMREQGMTHKEIARQLSPNLTAHNISYCIDSMRRPRRGVLLTPEEKQRIRTIVEENSGKVSFSEVMELVKREFIGAKRKNSAFNRADAYSASLPLYKARMEAADKDQIARDILSGATTVAEVARRLDVPTRPVAMVVDKFQSRMYSSVWTDQETEQLLEHARMHTPPYNWRVLSALLGTKSPRQCKCKFNKLKYGGAIPDKPEN